MKHHAAIVTIIAILTSCSESTATQGQVSNNTKKEPTSQILATVGKPAPDFHLKDHTGKTVKLSDHKGKTVVLEWFNPGCPFVVYGHEEGPLKGLAKKYTDQGVVWLAINSGAKGKEGYGIDKNVAAASKWGMKHPILFDEDGKVGHMYGAKTTPHMFVVNPQGVVVYAGAIDNAPFGKSKEDTKTNYVAEALTATLAGKPVAVSETKPYGCSVKYNTH